MKFDSLIRLPSCETGIWRRFGVHVFEGRLTVEHMDRLEAHGDEWNRKNPGRVVEMVIIYPSEARMTSQERARMMQLMKRWESQRVAAATVILAEGLTGAMHRSVLTGMMMIARPPHPAKVFGSVREAIMWLAPFVREVCKADLVPDELIAGVDELCATFRSRRRSKPE
jgi:hypothetical protein